jgi:hypothetical protein
MEIEINKIDYVRYMRKVLHIFVLIFWFSIISGQKSNKDVPPLKDRLFFGGNFSFELGTITGIEVSPLAGLWVRPRISIGVGPSYSYYKFGGIKTDIYGGKTFVQYVLVRDLDKFIPLGIHTSFFLHLEDEILSLDSDFWEAPVNANRFLINTVLSGAGLSQQVGPKLSLNLVMLWPLTDPGYEIHSSPELRIGIIFYL